MNSLAVQCSYNTSLTCMFLPCPPKKPLCIYSSHGFHRNTQTFSRSVSYPFKFYPSLCVNRSIVNASTQSDEGAVSMINFEDFVEKDFSFLDSDNFISSEDHNQKISRIISAGEIAESSKVLVSIPSEGFVDQLFDSAPCQSLLVVHDSILALACIKEKYDKVKCWQGELIYVPEKWAPFDVMFLYYLPGISFELNLVFEALSKHCISGARLVISHPCGRNVLEQERQEFPDVVVSDLPDKTTLHKVAADHYFDLTEFIDEHGFYLAVLKFNKERR